jgi:hypothetical protein
MKTMFGVLVIIIAACLWSLLSLESDIKTVEAKYRAVIGNRIVVGRDTLTITDYSLINSNLILSNGSACRYELAITNAVAKKSENPK